MLRAYFQNKILNSPMKKEAVVDFIWVNLGIISLTVF